MNGKAFLFHTKTQT